MYFLKIKKIWKNQNFIIFHLFMLTSELLRFLNEIMNKITILEERINLPKKTQHNLST